LKIWLISFFLAISCSCVSCVIEPFELKRKKLLFSFLFTLSICCFAKVAVVCIGNPIEGEISGSSFLFNLELSTFLASWIRRSIFGCWEELALKVVMEVDKSRVLLRFRLVWNRGSGLCFMKVLELFEVDFIREMPFFEPLRYSRL